MAKAQELFKGLDEEQGEEEESIIPGLSGGPGHAASHTPPNFWSKVQPSQGLTVINSTCENINVFVWREGGPAPVVKRRTVASNLAVGLEGASAGGNYEVEYHFPDGQDAAYYHSRPYHRILQVPLPDKKKSRLAIQVGTDEQLLVSGAPVRKGSVWEVTNATCILSIDDRMVRRPICVSGHFEVYDHDGHHHALVRCGDGCGGAGVIAAAWDEDWTLPPVGCYALSNCVCLVHSTHFTVAGDIKSGGAPCPKSEIVSSTAGAGDGPKPLGDFHLYRDWWPV